MLHFHKTNEFIGIFYGGRGYLRIIPCMFYMIDRRLNNLLLSIGECPSNSPFLKNN
jgi:hypothetical protein